MTFKDCFVVWLIYFPVSLDPCCDLLGFRSDNPQDKVMPFPWKFVL